jgi:hypothetical protein
VRPARSDSDSFENPTSHPTKSRQQEDTTSIIQFNCTEVLDFSTGSVVLPLRITCYCRHHREKVGFNVHFVMTDHAERIVGTGTSRPIMITDDHKTSTGSNNIRNGEFCNAFSGMELEWSQVAGMIGDAPSEVGAPSKRKKDVLSSSSAHTKKRLKPYDTAAKRNRASRETSLCTIPSPSTSFSTLPATRSPTPSSTIPLFLNSNPSPQPRLPQLYHSPHESESSPDALITPLDSPIINMPAVISKPEYPSSVSSSLSMPITTPPSVVPPPHPHRMPFMFFDSAHLIQLPLPTIHRLIPNTGPTHGGIEVTILGANFHPSVQLNCVFGDVAASSTQRWSDNTLVCVLPPRAAPGVVAVWFDGFPKVEDQTNSPPSLFTYSDESDRAL